MPPLLTPPGLGVVVTAGVGETVSRKGVTDVAAENKVVVDMMNGREVFLREYGGSRFSYTSQPSSITKCGEERRSDGRSIIRTRANSGALDGHNNNVLRLSA